MIKLVTCLFIGLFCPEGAEFSLWHAGGAKTRGGKAMSIRTMNPRGRMSDRRYRAAVGVLLLGTLTVAGPTSSAVAQEEQVDGLSDGDVGLTRPIT